MILGGALKQIATKALVAELLAEHSVNKRCFKCSAGGLFSRVLEEHVENVVLNILSVDHFEKQLADHLKRTQCSAGRMFCRALGRPFKIYCTRFAAGKTLSRALCRAFDITCFKCFAECSANVECWLPGRLFSHITSTMRVKIETVCYLVDIFI